MLTKFSKNKKDGKFLKYEKIFGNIFMEFEEKTAYRYW
jgi:hypothetical protein